MFLSETPHIKLRKANGLLNIDYTAADIIFNNKEDAAARSYNTLIGIYTKDETGRKYYLETAGVYSTTTAAKHKPRARRLASYNNYEIITDIRPEYIHDFNKFYDGTYNITEILQEQQERKDILKALYENENNAAAIIHAKTTGKIKARKAPEGKQFKNGNYLTKYFYVTNFKYFSNIYYELNLKAVKKQVQTRTGPAVTNQYKYNIVNISW